MQLPARWRFSIPAQKQTVMILLMEEILRWFIGNRSKLFALFFTSHVSINRMLWYNVNDNYF